MTRCVTQLADGAPNPTVTGERRIWFGHSYCGQLTHWRGLGWTHSLQRFGTNVFVSPDLAEKDFWQTKVRLTPDVHKAIFG